LRSRNKGTRLGSAEADTLGLRTESVRAAAENAVPPAISNEVCTNSMERAES